MVTTIAFLESKRKELLMTAPRAVRPGRPVRGSSTGRPVMAALDLLGRRWTLRLLWELRDGPLGARTILGRCPGLSSSVLYQRLRDLTASGLIERDGDDYALTPIGSSLRTALQPLDSWANRWANATARAEPLS
jgi:DNA-binding HxlR family transcriptional regulator